MLNKTKMHHKVYQIFLYQNLSKMHFGTCGTLVQIAIILFKQRNSVPKGVPQLGTMVQTVPH